MFFKKKRQQVMDAWGEICDEAPERKPAGQRAIASADKLPDAARRRRYAIMTAAVFLIIAAALVFGTFAALTSTAEQAGGAAASGEAPASADGSAKQGGQALDSATSKYANISKWEFLSDESKAEFAARFDQYAEEQGLGDGPAMCYSRVDADAGVYTAWLSYPAGERFFKVTFVAADKSFAFEECAMPDGLPEVNYAAEQTKAAQENRTPEAQQAPAADYPSQPDSSYVSTDRSEQEAAQGQPHQWVGCTSASSLSGFLDASAAAMLPDSVTGWLSSKGYSANAADCQVDLASVSGTASLMGFSMKCTTTSGEVTLDCEWNAPAGQFGFALAK